MSRSGDDAARLFRRCDLLEVVDSTNEYLKGFLEEGEPRMVVAREQTAGRGRFNRSWHSPPGEGLYISYLLYPGWATRKAHLINMVAGLAVIETILAMGTPREPLRIKLPNDVLLGGKKVAGILTEMSSLKDRVLWTIVGIGVNLYHSEFPPEIRHKATSLLLGGVRVQDPADFWQALTSSIELLLRGVQGGREATLQETFEGWLVAGGTYS